MRYVLLLTTIIFFFTTALSAQSYIFSYKTDSYINLINPNSINNGKLWDQIEYKIPIGFNFEYFGFSTDTIHTHEVATNFLIFHKDSIFRELMIPFGASLVDYGIGEGTSQSNFSFQTEGIEGTRICKIEWKKAGFFGEYNEKDFCIDYVNFQVWLFEDGNHIEIHFGPNDILSPELDYSGETGASVFLSHMMTNNFNTWSQSSLWLSGNAANPEAQYSADEKHLDGTIPNGMVYRFQYTPNSVFERTNKASFSIYPNPTSSKLTLTNISNTKEEGFSIYSIEGVIIKSGLVRGNEIIDITSLHPGVYFIRIKEAIVRFVKL
jgi:hypothetical protein